MEQWKGKKIQLMVKEKKEPGKNQVTQKVGSMITNKFKYVSYHKNELKLISSDVQLDCF